MDRKTTFLVALSVAMLTLPLPPLSAQTGDEITVNPESDVLLAAGNIVRAPGTAGNCAAGTGSTATATLLETLPGRIHTLGDNVTPGDSAAAYSNCFESTWGRSSLEARLYAGVGNDEYDGDSTAIQFENNFPVDRRGDDDKFFYAYDYGPANSWRVISLNSVCAQQADGGRDNCMEEMLAWLDLEFRENPRECTIAVFHHPRFTSANPPGIQTDARNMQGLWEHLWHNGVDVAISAHARHYERFNPLDAFGRLDPHGMRSFIVGTGGQAGGSTTFTPFSATPRPGSASQIPNTFGVVEFTLSPGSYEWEFVPVAGSSGTDAGTSACRNDAAPTTTAELSGPLTNEGSYIGPVEVALTATDDFSDSPTIEFRLDGGDWTLYVAPFEVSGEGSHTLEFRATDPVGHSEEVKSKPFSIDVTPPTVEADVEKDTLWPPNGRLINVGLDIVSDVSAVSTDVDLTSSEPAGAVAPDIVFNEGTGTLKLRAERLEEGPGRTYTISVTVTDASGNQGVDHATVFVPHDLGQTKPIVPPTGLQQIAGVPGPDPESPALVKILGEPDIELGDAFDDPSSHHGGSIAVCNLDKDPLDEIVVGRGPGEGNGSSLRILDADGSLVGSLEDVLEGADGVAVACGDVDGNGLNEIVAIAASGNDGTLKVLAGDGTLRSTFQPFESGDGWRVATADTKNDGAEEIVVAPAGPGAPADVKVFDVDGEMRTSFSAFEMEGGVRIAGGDMVGDGREEIVAAPGPLLLSPGIVRTYRDDGVVLEEFAAPDPTFHLKHYGYHHAHHVRFGFDLYETESYTNWAHLQLPEFVTATAGRGMGSILQLGLLDNESTWANRIAFVKDQLSAEDFESISAILIKDQADVSGWDTAKQQRALDAVEAEFPDEIPRMIIYTDQVSGAFPGTAPPEELDWVGVDNFLPNGFDNTGCADRAAFEAGPLAQLQWAADWADSADSRRVVVFGQSFKDLLRPLPSTCQQSWFMEAALEEKEVVGFVWFMYGFAQGSNIEGVSMFDPDLGIDLHRRLFENVQFGAWGAKVAVGDIDGDGRDEIAVSRGEGPANKTGFTLFTASGEEVGIARQEVFPGRAFGVNLAFGHLLEP